MKYEYDLEFLQWLMSINPEIVAKILYQYYNKIVKIKKNSTTESPVVIDSKVQLHLDSILLYDDVEIAELSYEILKQYDSRIINDEVKARLKVLGIKE
jgi:hypothetical protein